MKTKLNRVSIIAIGLLFIGGLAFGPASVWAETNEAAEAGSVEWGTEDLEVQTNLTTDLVRPCRILDTRRIGVIFTPNTFLDLYVYGPGPGSVGMIQQGGNPAGCPAPRGEPRGVILNVTAVPVAGSGNFRLYPPNVSAPTASFVNYRAGVQNVANGGTFETWPAAGPREIRVINSFGISHLVIDVMGYLN